MGCAKLKIVQHGGFAGEIPLLDVDGGALAAEARPMLEEACGRLAALRASAAASEPIGADIPHYTVETEGSDGQRQSFRLPHSAGEEVSALVGRLSPLASPR